MIRVRRKYVRRSFDYETTLFSVGAVALWFLWLSVSEPLASVNDGDEFEITCRAEMPANGLHVSRPDFDPPPGLGISGHEQEKHYDELTEEVNLRASILEREGAFNASGEQKKVSEKLAAAVMPVGSYRAKWQDKGTDRPSLKAVKGVNIEITGGLQAKGFSLPGVEGTFAGISDESWEVVLSVEVGDNRRPEHVFVLSSSGNRKVDASVVRIVMQGETAKGSCSGRVVVSFGKEK